MPSLVVAGYPYGGVPGVVNAHGYKEQRYSRSDIERGVGVPPEQRGRCNKACVTKAREHTTPDPVRKDIGVRRSPRLEGDPD